MQLRCQVVVICRHHIELWIPKCKNFTDYFQTFAIFLSIDFTGKFVVLLLLCRSLRYAIYKSTDIRGPAAARGTSDEVKQARKSIRLT